MLGPPNKGSEVVDRFGEWAVFGVLNGPAGSQLGTLEQSLPKKLPKATFEVGVIAGSQSISPLFSNVIEGADDGKVSVESTMVSGMKDHIVMPVTHTFMMNDPAVMLQTIQFLQSGTFDRSLSSDSDRLMEFTRSLLSLR